MYRCTLRFGKYEYLISYQVLYNLRWISRTELHRCVAHSANKLQVKSFMQGHLLIMRNH